MSDFCQILPFNEAPTPKSTVTPANGGTHSAGNYDYLIVARYGQNPSNVYNYGALNRVPDPAASGMVLADRAEILAHWMNIAVGANQKVTIDWIPPVRKQPWYFQCYRWPGHGGGFDWPRLEEPATLLQAKDPLSGTVYTSGYLPGHLTGGEFSGTAAFASTQFPIVDFDATNNEFVIDGNYLMHFGATTVFSINGTGHNDGAHTALTCRLIWGERSIQTAIHPTVAVISDTGGEITANVGNDTFNQTVAAGVLAWGWEDSVSFKPADSPVLLRPRNTRVASGRLARKSYVDQRLVDEIHFTLNYMDCGYDVSDRATAWLRLAYWLETGNDLWLAMRHIIAGAWYAYGAKNAFIGRMEEFNHLGGAGMQAATELTFRFLVDQELV